MRGILKGEAASVSNPILQLFVRSAGLLVDPYSATFKIDDIHDPDVALANKVPLTSFNLTSDKVGTGRFAAATGSTSTWNLGTHRLTCTYKLSAAGPTYTQVHEFEVLDPADWGSSMEWTGYLSTRRVRQDTLVLSTVSTQTVHRYLTRIARQIETWCRRFFEPRYLELRVSGPFMSPILSLDEAIIAIDSVDAVWLQTDGESSITYDSTLYKVFNRHLDTGHDGDDRFDPKIELIDISNTVLRRATRGGYVWAEGSQNIRVKAVLGYTDPEYDPKAGRTLIGRTPEDIAYVSGLLLSRMAEDPSGSDPTVSRAGSVRSYRTRDQSITFGGAAAASGDGPGSGMSGDPIIDAILMKYGPPINVVGI